MPKKLGDIIVKTGQDFEGALGAPGISFHIINHTKSDMTLRISEVFKRGRKPGKKAPNA